MVEDANNYPRQIPNPDLLPEGWKTIEYMYKTGNYVGKTYTRFQSIDGRFKHILSVKAAVKVVAEANGEDVEKVLEEFDRKKKDLQMLEKMGNEAKRKEAGIVKGQEREDAIEEFRKRFGDLTGGMVASFPGWTSHAKLLENCGQAQRAHRMVHLYLAAFFVTMSPILICLRFNLDTDVADAFLALNGVLNVLLYSFQSSFSSAMWLDTGEAHGTVMAQWAGRSSIPVTFSMRVPLEVKVSAVQRAALAESEREIADMARARSDPREDQQSGAADTGRELTRCGWV